MALWISSLTDQIFIKAQRIRSIEQKGFQKIDEGTRNEFIGIVNYAIIGGTSCVFQYGGYVCVSVVFLMMVARSLLSVRLSPLSRCRCMCRIC